MKLFQIDVKSDFLNDFIIEEIYVEQPPSFENEKYIYRLCLQTFKIFIREWIFNGKSRQHFIHKEKKMMIYLLFKFMWMILFLELLVNLYARKFASSTQNEFEMSMIDELNFFLGFQINIKNTFLNDFIIEEIYVKQPLDF